MKIGKTAEICDVATGVIIMLGIGCMWVAIIAYFAGAPLWIIKLFGGISAFVYTTWGFYGGAFINGYWKSRKRGVCGKR